MNSTQSDNFQLFFEEESDSENEANKVNKQKPTPQKLPSKSVAEPELGWNVKKNVNNKKKEITKPNTNKKYETKQIEKQKKMTRIKVQKKLGLELSEIYSDDSSESFDFFDDSPVETPIPSSKYKVDTKNRKKIEKKASSSSDDIQEIEKPITDSLSIGNSASIPLPEEPVELTDPKKLLPDSINLSDDFPNEESRCDSPYSLTESDSELDCTNSCSVNDCQVILPPKDNNKHKQKEKKTKKESVSSPLIELSCDFIEIIPIDSPASSIELSAHENLPSPDEVGWKSKKSKLKVENCETDSEITKNFDNLLLMTPTKNKKQFESDIESSPSIMSVDGDSCSPEKSSLESQMSLGSSADPKNSDPSSLGLDEDNIEILRSYLDDNPNTLSPEKSNQKEKNSKKNEEILEKIEKNQEFDRLSHNDSSWLSEIESTSENEFIIAQISQVKKKPSNRRKSLAKMRPVPSKSVTPITTGKIVGKKRNRNQKSPSILDQELSPEYKKFKPLKSIGNSSPKTNKKIEKKGKKPEKKSEKKGKKLEKNKKKEQGSPITEFASDEELLELSPESESDRKAKTEVIIIKRSKEAILYPAESSESESESDNGAESTKNAFSEPQEVKASPGKQKEGFSAKFEKKRNTKSLSPPKNTGKASQQPKKKKQQKEKKKKKGKNELASPPWIHRSKKSSKKEETSEEEEEIQSSSEPTSTDAESNSELDEHFFKINNSTKIQITDDSPTARGRYSSRISYHGDTLSPPKLKSKPKNEDAQSDCEKEGTESPENSIAISEKLVKRIKNKDQDRDLFRGFSFLITGIDNLEIEDEISYAISPSPSGLCLLKKIIQVHGGQVVDKFTEKMQHRNMHKSYSDLPSTLIISNQTKRTEKYLLGIVYGCSLLHFNWIVACCEKQTLLNFAEKTKYQLEAGYSKIEGKPIHLWKILQKKAYRYPPDIFDEMRCEVVGATAFKEHWSKILRASGAKVVSRLGFQELEKEGRGVDVIISDVPVSEWVIARADRLKVEICSADYVLHCILHRSRKIDRKLFLIESD